jgi:Trk-type K+ transport system membrane component
LIQTGSPFGDLHVSAGMFWRVALDWVPFLVFVALLLFGFRRLKKTQGGQIEEMREYRELHLQELRKINASLDRISATISAGAARDDGATRHD